MSEMDTNLPAATPAGLPAAQAAALQKMAKAKFADTFSASELLLPWLVRIQSTSDFIKRNKPNYIPDASIGDITDTLTLRLRKIQTVILVKFEIHYSTFKPGGGKLVKQWFTDRSAYDAARFPEGKDFGKKVDAEGNEVQETPMYYALMVDPPTGMADPCCIGFGSTQAKKTKRINTLARADILVPNDAGVMMPVTPPIYARLFDLTTVDEANDQNAWVGWKADVGDLVLMNENFGESWWAKAEAFREQIEKGNVRPMPPEGAEEADDRGGYDRAANARTVGEGSAAPAAKLDDDIPF